MIGRRRRIVLLLLFGALGGCGGRRPVDVGKAAPQTDVPLFIINHHWLDITIFVLHDGQRSRIGNVEATSDATFILPARLLGQGREITLIGDPVGSPTQVTTETLLVQPGQSVEWTLESGLERSSVAVY